VGSNPTPAAILGKTSQLYGSRGAEDHAVLSWIGRRLPWPSVNGLPQEGQVTTIPAAVVGKKRRLSLHSNGRLPFLGGIRGIAASTFG
jgi:hypothetical protein